MHKVLNKLFCAFLAVTLVVGFAPVAPIASEGSSAIIGFAEQAFAATKPAKVTSVKIKSVKTTSLKVTWKAASSKKVKGYYVSVSTSKSFPKSKTKTYKVTKRTTTSKTVKGLKAGKKYYAKVRAYTVSNGKKVYSSWSSKKSVTTKKKASKTSTSYVYVTATGSKYHHKGCPTLSRSRSLTKLSVSKAKSYGYTACKVCF